MCGRICLTLDPEDLKCACKFNIDKNQMTPEYRNEHNIGLKYSPSFNISPGEVCPIIVSASHFVDDADASDRLLIPALWGIVPRWVDDFKKHGLTTNNARLENILNSKLYKPGLDKGKRAVIPIEGFYEWNTTNSKLKSSERAVYYVYMKQKPDIKIEKKSTWNCENVKLMYVAGLFDIWKNSSGESIYSFTVLTFESNEVFSGIHHRTPAILETEKQISDWLNFENVTSECALKLLKHPANITWHEVSKYVNNSRNKLKACNKHQKSIQPNMLSWIKNRQSDKLEDKDSLSKTSD